MVKGNWYRSKNTQTLLLWTSWKRIEYYIMASIKDHSIFLGKISFIGKTWKSDLDILIIDSYFDEKSHLDQLFQEGTWRKCRAWSDLEHFCRATFSPLIQVFPCISKYFQVFPCILEHSTFNPLIQVCNIYRCGGKYGQICNFP